MIIDHIITAQEASPARAAETEDFFPSVDTAYFVIVGKLQADARSYSLPDGRPCLQVLVGQHLQRHRNAHHMLATMIFDTTPQARITARETAAWLYAGTKVVVQGRGLVNDDWHGINVLRLVKCDLIRKINPP